MTLLRRTCASAASQFASAVRVAVTWPLSWKYARHPLLPRQARLGRPCFHRMRLARRQGVRIDDAEPFGDGYHCRCPLRYLIGRPRLTKMVSCVPLKCVFTLSMIGGLTGTSACHTTMNLAPAPPVSSLNSTKTSVRQGGQGARLAILLQQLAVGIVVPHRVHDDAVIGIDVSDRQHR